jgi:hypothetical protein
MPLVLLVYVAGVPLSRRAVGMAFPAFTASLLSLRSILLFNRAKTQDKDVRKLEPGATFRMFSCVPCDCHWFEYGWGTSLTTTTCAPP